MTSFWGELRRRNVLRVGVAYLAATWLLVQVADVVLSNFDAPAWIIQALIFSSALGFPVVLGWFSELTPEGIKAASEVEVVEGIKLLTVCGRGTVTPTKSRVAALAVVGIMTAAGPSLAAETKLTIPVFPFPGLGAFLPPVIDAKDYDNANGLDITWKTEPAGVYRTNFAAGTNKIGGSATLLADVAKLNELGVETVFLFNIFDYWGTVVVAADSDINTLKDLQGNKLAASLATMNYVMFRYAAKVSGLDISKTEIQGLPVQGLIPMALIGRVAGVQVWEPAHSQLVYGNSNFRALDVVGIVKTATGQSKVPYVGIAAHKSWVEENTDLIPKLFETYAMAATFIDNNPEEAATIISDASGGRLTEDVLAELIKSDRMGMDVYWVSDALPAARATFMAAMDIQYLTEMPSDDIVYVGK